MVKHLPIRTKITFGFILVAILGLGTAIANDYFHSRLKTVREKQGDLLKVQKLFFEKEKLLQETLITSKSSDFQDKSVKDISNHFIQNDYLLATDTNKFLNSKNRSINIFFREIVKEQKQIGFKSYGLIGKFREMIHQIEEDPNADISNEQILKIRRIEKDFLLRNDKDYAWNLNVEIEKLLLGLDPNSKTRKNLEAYLQYFNLCAVSMQSLGNNDKGLIKDLNILFDSVNDYLKQTDENYSLQASNIEKYNSNFQTIILIAILIITILTIYILSRQISLPIRELQKSINDFVHSDFKHNSNKKLLVRKDEIGNLMRNFEKLEKKVSKQFEKYKENAEKRQDLLKEQNEKIKIQKYLLKESRNKLEIRNKEYTDSLYYAQKLQKAIFPSREKLQHLLGSHGIMFKPKDIVSGDFYWTEKLGNEIYFAVGDCTGHGIPGAFLSILCTNFLNNALIDNQLKQPNEILKFVSNKISNSLNQADKSSEIKDGMDIILCCYNLKSGKFKFAGAQRPLLILRNGEILEFKPDKFPIGWVMNPFQQQFTLKEFQLKKGDRIFLFTDGYADQFGGSRNKKLKSAKMKDLLIESESKTIESQMIFMNQFIMDWKGYQNEQIDDICMLGIEYNAELRDSSSTLHFTVRKNQQKNKGQNTIYA